MGPNSGRWKRYVQAWPIKTSCNHYVVHQKLVEYCMSTVIEKYTTTNKTSYMGASFPSPICQLKAKGAKT